MAERGSIFKKILTIIFSVSLFLGAKEPSAEVKLEIAPFLMPHHHPLKAKLDTFFSSSRAIFNLKTLKDSGFNSSFPRKFTSLIVTSHPEFPGYIFKLYLDVQQFHKNRPEYYFWLLRVKGADQVREQIKALGLSSQFKTPKKWIYELPKYPKPPKGYYTKYYILVEEDMDILPDYDNRMAWSGDVVTEDLLYSLFKIIKKVGLKDAPKPDNIPFCKDGRIAFIDTQTFGSKHISYYKLNKFLSRSNKSFWKAITHQ